MGARTCQGGEDRPAGALAGARVAVVGGASGMGLATACAAADEGASVVVVSHTQASVDRALGVLPGGSTGRAVDALDRPGLDALFTELGNVDHLVYTAAEPPLTGPITRLPVDDVRAAFQTRYFGALTTVSAAVPHVSAGGSITLTSGAAAVRPRGTSGVIASITGAMEALTRALAVELAPVRVNLVRPGFTRSDLWADLDEDVRDGLFKQTAESNLVGHVGETSELAQAYVYCMTQTYATGSIVTVDGGYALI